MSKLSETVGNWAPHIKEELSKSYMKEVGKAITLKKKSVFETCYPDNFFDVYKNCDYDNIKVLYIVDNPKFTNRYLYEIEEEFCNGLDITLCIKEDYQWLVDQGIMFYPLHLTYGDDGSHKEWRRFTEEVLLKITGEKNVLVVTNKGNIKELLFHARPWTDFINTLKPWRMIDSWIKKYYKKEIQWGTKSKK